MAKGKTTHGRVNKRLIARGFWAIALLMIPRYSRPQMASIWSDEAKFKTWLEVELAVCEAWARMGKVPQKALAKIKRRAAGLGLTRISKIEEIAKHDVVAFLTALNEAVGEESRYVHLGLTSSDILDTALAMQLKKSADIILDDIDRLLAVLKRRACEFKKTPIIGRTHGIHAEPTTFGLKLALWYKEFERQRARLACAKRHMAVGKISGAVGTFANVPPQVEAYVCKKLGLEPDPISTQIIQRDRHAHFFTILALIASSIEKVATEIRHLQRTEVLEAEEPFAKGQKGSSAMPHKRNPILSENLCGLARIVRANSLAAMEDVALWHERDISHSSVERIIGPDSTTLVDFMLNRLIEILDGLVVYPKTMKRNLDRLGGLIHSQRVLLALVSAGMPREEAYGLVQRHAMRVWDEGGDFEEMLKQDASVKKYLSPKELDSLFDLGYHTKYVDEIFRRVFGMSLRLPAEAQRAKAGAPHH